MIGVKVVDTSEGFRVVAQFQNKDNKVVGKAVKHSFCKGGGQHSFWKGIGQLAITMSGKF